MSDSMSDSGRGPVALYGIIEIASALGVDRRKVAVWHGRGKLPPADFRASGRPFWKPETITPWITSHTEQTAAPEGPAAVQVSSPTPASSPSTCPPSSDARPAPAARPPRHRPRAQGRRPPAIGQDPDRSQGQDQEGGDPYELARSSQGWTLSSLGQPIGTIRPAWSATGRSKRWQAYSPTGTRLDARTYPTVQAAAVRVAQAHRHAAERRR